MHAPRACLAVLRSAAVEFGSVVSLRDQVHDVHWGKWGRGFSTQGTGRESEFPVRVPRGEALYQSVV